MIASLAPVMLAAALRALAAALAVWTGLRLLRVSNVLAQKTAWGLVLVAALAMPLVPGGQWVPAWAALRLPIGLLSQPAAEKVAAPAVAADRYPAPSISNFDEQETAAAPADNAPDAVLPVPVVQNESTVKATKHGHRLDGAKTPDVSALEKTQTEVQAPGEAASVGIDRANNKAALHGTSGRATAIWPLIYLAVFSALLLRLLFGLAAALRLWMTAKPVPDLVESDGKQVRSSARVASPVNIGSGIVLPADYEQWDKEKLRIVLAHECSHIRQGDFYLQLAASLYSCLFWFSPLGWWLKRKLNELGEAISDRAGLEEAASRSSYAHVLLEFAALPRPTLTGVAMARTSHLSQRIERLLNESSFRQSFAAGGRRALAAILLVPIAMFVATTLVRVEAATPAPQAEPTATPQSATTGQSTPEQVTEPAPAPVPDAAPAVPAPPQAVPEPAPQAQPAPPPPPGAPAAVGVAPVPPSPHAMAPIAPLPPDSVFKAMPPMPPMPDRLNSDAMRMAINGEIAADLAAADAKQFLYRGSMFTNDGDPYALVDSDGKVVKPRNGFFYLDNGAGRESIEKARKMAHGSFLWFQHEGKTYMVDDPAVVAQIQAMNKPMDDLGDQMRAVGKQMRDAGAQAREKARAKRDTTVQTPDLSKEIADLKAAEASLQAKQGGTITRKDLEDLQREIGRIQRELGAVQGKIGAEEWTGGAEMKEFSQQMGKYGSQMGELGKQMGQIARENQTKMKGIINDSLSNGKAKPVE